MWMLNHKEMSNSHGQEVKTHESMKTPDSFAPQGILTTYQYFTGKHCYSLPSVNAANETVDAH